MGAQFRIGGWAMIDAVVMRPCPFCGVTGEPEIDGDPAGDLWFVRCASCNARGSDLNETEAGAIKDWNTRPSHDAPTEVEPWPEREMRRAGSLGMVRAYPQNAAEWEERCLAYEAAHNRALTKQHALLREVLSLEAEGPK